MSFNLLLSIACLFVWLRWCRGKRMPNVEQLRAAFDRKEYVVSDEQKQYKTQVVRGPAPFSMREPITCDDCGRTLVEINEDGSATIYEEASFGGSSPETPSDQEPEILHVTHAHCYLCHPEKHDDDRKEARQGMMPISGMGMLGILMGRQVPVEDEKPDSRIQYPWE